MPVKLAGEVQEWLNWHAWKACALQNGTEGSNPSLSARNVRGIVGFAFWILNNRKKAHFLLRAFKIWIKKINTNKI